MKEVRKEESDGGIRNWVDMSMVSRCCREYSGDTYTVDTQVPKYSNFHFTASCLVQTGMEP